MSFSSALFVTALIISCNSKEKKSIPMQHEMHAEETTMKDQSPDSEELAFNDQTTGDIFQNYIAVKEALIASDTEAAQKAANRLSKSLSENNEAVEYAEEVANSTDIDVQRKAFSQLTTPVENLLKGNISKGTVYKDYCPMAFNEGAYWLSEYKEIKNPFYGDKMLTCGSVKGEIR